MTNQGLVDPKSRDFSPGVDRRCPQVSSLEKLDPGKETPLPQRRWRLPRAMIKTLTPYFDLWPWSTKTVHRQRPRRDGPVVRVSFLRQENREDGRSEGGHRDDRLGLSGFVSQETQSRGRSIETSRLTTPLE